MSLDLATLSRWVGSAKGVHVVKHVDKHQHESLIHHVWRKSCGWLEKVDDWHKSVELHPPNIELKLIVQVGSFWSDNVTLVQY